MLAKRFMTVLLTTLMVAGSIFSNVSFGATSSSLKVLFNNNGSAVSTNQIYTGFKLQNIGTGDIDLSKITIKYYFTKDDNKSMKFYSDYVSTGSVSAAISDNFIELKLSGGILSPVGSQYPKFSEMTIQGRAANIDWSNIDQSNDYSYTGPMSQYAENSNIAVFQSDSLIYGTIPGGTVTNPPSTYIPTNTPTPAVTKGATPTRPGSTSKGEVYMSVDKAKAAVGDIIAATLSVKNFDNVSGYQANIKYDPSVLQPVYLDGTPYDNTSSPELGTLLNKRYNGTDMASNDLKMEKLLLEGPIYLWRLISLLE